MFVVHAKLQRFNLLPGERCNDVCVLLALGSPLSPYLSIVVEVLSASKLNHNNKTGQG
jgi:hypothetical protein